MFQQYKERFKVFYKAIKKLYARYSGLILAIKFIYGLIMVLKFFS